MTHSKDRRTGFGFRTTQMALTLAGAQRNARRHQGASAPSVCYFDMADAPSKSSGCRCGVSVLGSTQSPASGLRVEVKPGFLHVGIEPGLYRSSSFGGHGRTSRFLTRKQVRIQVRPKGPQFQGRCAPGSPPGLYCLGAHQFVTPRRKKGFVRARQVQMVPLKTPTEKAIMERLGRRGVRPRSCSA